MKSNFFNLNTKDFLKGATVAVITAVLAALTTLLQTGVLFDKSSLPVIGTAALTAFIAYITKNLFTNSVGEMFTTEKSNKAITFKNTGKYTKLLILTFVLSGIGITAVAQGLFKPVPKTLFEVKKNDANRLTYFTIAPEKGKWITRWDVGISGVSYDFKKGSEPVPFSAFATGLSFEYFENDNGVPWNVWGASLLLLKDTQTNEGFGIGLYGKYNTNMVGIINAGAHYDFSFKKVVADILLSVNF